jgi:hypothetical protein
MAALRTIIAAATSVQVLLPLACFKNTESWLTSSNVAALVLLPVVFVNMVHTRRHTAIPHLIRFNQTFFMRSS